MTSIQLDFTPSWGATVHSLGTAESECVGHPWGLKQNWHNGIHDPNPHQAQDWIEERVRQLREPIPPGDLKDKLRLLRKHQAFEAEIQAHEEVITSVTKVTGPRPQSYSKVWALG